jgi:hypothetical protein
MNQQRGYIRSSERKPEEGRGIEAWSNDPRQNPKVGKFVLKCLATAKTRQRLYSFSASKSNERRGLVA